MRRYFLVVVDSRYSTLGRETHVQSRRPEDWQLQQSDRVYSFAARDIQHARAGWQHAQLQREPGL